MNQPKNVQVVGRGEMVNLTVGLSLIYQGVAPAYFEHPEAFTKRLVEALHIAVAEYSSTLTADWLQPAGFEIIARSMRPKPPPKGPTNGILGRL